MNASVQASTKCISAFVPLYQRVTRRSSISRTVAFGQRKSEISRKPTYTLFEYSHLSEPAALPGFRGKEEVRGSFCLCEDLGCAHDRTAKLARRVAYGNGEFYE